MKLHSTENVTLDTSKSLFGSDPWLESDGILVHTYSICADSVLGSVPYGSVLELHALILEAYGRYVFAL